MTSLAYHLRANKAVDRLMLIETLRRVGRPNEIAQYTYYGFGGAYLEEFRLLHDYFPELPLVSIEVNKEIIKRQDFHRPCENINLKSVSFKEFLTTYNSSDMKSIFWLDNTGASYGHFEDFITLVGRVAAGSIIKITLSANHGTVRSDGFQSRFRGLIPATQRRLPINHLEAAVYLQGMLKIAAQRAFERASGFIFQPIASFYYDDSSPMLTLTGMVVPPAEVDQTRRLFDSWQFANLNWAAPRLIDMPVLTAKERLHLQRFLPTGADAGRILFEQLNYCTEDNEAETIAKLQQYSEFYRYYPLFIRAIP